MKHINKFRLFENSNDENYWIESAFEKITLEYEVYSYTSGGFDSKLTTKECIDIVLKGQEVYIVIDDTKINNVLDCLEYLRDTNTRIRIDGDGYIYVQKFRTS